MKRKVILSLIMAALLATPLAASAAGKRTPTADEIKARAAEAKAKGKKVVVKLRAGTKILVGDKAQPFEFTKGARVSGRVTEIRENDFTLSGASRDTGEVTAVISYSNVVSIKRPSGFEKALKAVGMYSALAALTAGLLPIYLVLALTGQLPSC
jgi:hypothetical protein